MKCAFCGRFDENVDYLVAGPDGNNICSECLIKVSEGILNEDNIVSTKVPCSFCGIADRMPHGIGIERQVTICAQCTLNALQTIKGSNQSIRNAAQKLSTQIMVHAGDVDKSLYQAHET